MFLHRGQKGKSIGLLCYKGGGGVEGPRCVDKMASTIWLLELLFSCQDNFLKDCDFVMFRSVLGWTGRFLCLRPVISVTQTLVPCAFPVWLCVGSVPFLSPVASFLDSPEVGWGYLAAKNDREAWDDSVFILNCNFDCWSEQLSHT